MLIFLYRADDNSSGQYILRPDELLYYPDDIVIRPDDIVVRLDELVYRPDDIKKNSSQGTYGPQYIRLTALFKFPFWHAPSPITPFQDYDTEDIDFMKTAILDKWDLNRDGKINKAELTMLLLQQSRLDTTDIPGGGGTETGGGGWDNFC